MRKIIENNNILSNLCYKHPSVREYYTTFNLKALIFTILIACGIFSNASVLLGANSKQKDQFTVVIDAGHGGKDFGAIDNGAREKDINLQVALKVGEMVNKKLKDTKIIFTRKDDSFLSLQERANVANNAKADFFISIHTNSVDAKNKNRTTVAGASVYTQGNHKDDANMEVARRENAVIELENGYEQKYSGFDPNKDESYIIFELAQKNNLSESAHFAKDVQDNLVKIAGRRDRGVHQAGFWVLWATSMPAVLIELDFICNPESTKFMTSKEGVEELADAIFQTIKEYEKSYLQKRKMLSDFKPDFTHVTDQETITSEEYFTEPTIDPAIEARIDALIAEEKAKTDNQTRSIAKVSKSERPQNETDSGSAKGDKSIPEPDQVLVLASAPESEKRDLSHSNLEATQKQRIARNNIDGRRRRSTAAREASEERNLEVSRIELKSESVGNKELATVDNSSKNEQKLPANANVNQKGKKKAKQNKKSEAGRTTKMQVKSFKGKKLGTNKVLSDKSLENPAPNRETASSSSVNNVEHAGRRKSIKSKSL